MKLFGKTTLLLVGSVLVYAGGNDYIQTSSVQSIADTLCIKSKVFVEKDAQLMWQDQAYTDAEVGAYKRQQSVGKAGSWNYAMNYCDSLDYQGYADWRLPTSDELKHIHHKVDRAFSYHQTGDFWTSTPSVAHKYNVVYTVDAYSYQRKKTESNYIRCVRCWLPETKPTLLGVLQDATVEISER